MKMQLEHLLRFEQPIQFDQLPEAQRLAWTDQPPRPSQAPQPQKNVRFHVAIRRVTIGLLLGTASLLVLNLISLYLLHRVEGRAETDFTVKVIAAFNQYVDLNDEGNLPTMYSCFLLLMASGLLGVVAAQKHKQRLPFARQWGVLSAVFIYLMLDEGTQLHERISHHLHVQNLNGYLFYAWVIPYVLLMLFLGVYMLPFLLNLPARTRNLFILSGIIYVGGAVGVEMIEGHFDYLYTLNNQVSMVLRLLEEVLEMVGVILFSYAIMEYLSRYGKPIKISWELEEK